MKIKIIFLWVAVISGILFTRLSYADELADLKAQMNLMQEKIEELERKEKARIATEMRKDHMGQEAIIEKVEELEADVDFLQEQQDSFLTRLGENVEFDIYATLEYENFENTDSVIDGRNLEILAGANLTDRLKIFAEIEFERTAKTSSGSRQGEVEVEQSWLEYNINEFINPRAGIILVPFGKYNAEHFAPFRDLTDRPIVMRRVIPTTWAEPGIGLTGNASPGEILGGRLSDIAIDYQFFFINGLTNEFTDKGLRSARGAFGSDNNNNKAMVGRLGIGLFTGMEVGLSGYHGSHDRKGHDINGFDVDWKFTKGPFEFLGEYALFDLDHGGVESDGTTLAPEELSGIYIQTNYHFWFDFLNNTFLGRRFENPTFTSSIRFDKVRIDDDSDTGTGANKEERLTIGFNYRPVETWVFKMDYQFNSTRNETLERGDNNGVTFSISAAF